MTKYLCKKIHISLFLLQYTGSQDTQKRSEGAKGKSV